MKKNPAKWKKLSLLALVVIYGVSLIANLFTTALLGFILWALAVASLVVFAKSTKQEAVARSEELIQALDHLGGVYNDNNPDSQE